MSAFFRALSVSNFRLWFFGVMLSYMGTWILITTLSWVALTVLSDEDALFTGIASALVFVPSLFLVGVTGLVVDRWNRRKLLITTHSSMAIIAVSLGLAIVTGSRSLPLFLTLALALGLTVAFDQPARHSFVLDLVPTEMAQNAVALNTTSYNVARLVAPAIAGLLMVVMDPGVVFLISSVMFVCTIVAIRLMRKPELESPQIPAGDRSLLGGIAYLLRRPTSIIVIMVTFPMAMFAMNFPLITSTMAVHFGEGSASFGLLSTFFGAGAVVGALLVGLRTHPRIGFVLAGSISAVVMIAAGSFTTGFWGFGISLFLLGGCSATIFTTGNAMVQIDAAPAVRGRVIAIYLAMTAGAGPATAPLLGWIINNWGPPGALQVMAILLFTVTAIGWFWDRSLKPPK